MNISLFNLKLKRRGNGTAVWHSLPKVVAETSGNGFEVHLLLPPDDGILYIECRRKLKFIHFEPLENA